MRWGTPSTIGEIIQITADQLQGRSHWHSRNLSSSYQDPVVVAHTLSKNGSDPSHIRVRDVQSHRFEWKIEEWSFHSPRRPNPIGAHITETAPFLVMEQGSHRLQDGTLVKADRIQVDHTWTWVDFQGEPFPVPPVVLSGVSTENDDTPVVVRMRDVSETGFWVRLQEEERQDGAHDDETVSWVALMPGQRENDGRAFRVDRSASINHRFGAITFGSLGFSEAPVFMGNVETSSGGNPAGLRFINLSANQVEVQVEEERSADLETWHVLESVAWIVWQAPGRILRETQDPGDGEEQDPGDGEEQDPGDGEEQDPGDGEEQDPGDGEEQDPGDGELHPEPVTDGQHPPSSVIAGITWHEETLYQAAGGSDIWASTWLEDGRLLLAWGDGVGFGPAPNDQHPVRGAQAGPERAGYGFSQIVTDDPSQLVPPPLAPPPENTSYPAPDRSNPNVPTNLLGGLYPEFPGTLGGRGDQGKVGGMLAVDGVVYAWVNLQRLEGGGFWPDVHHGLIWSTQTEDSALGERWERAGFRFDRGPDNFKPSTFVQYGRDYDPVEGMDPAQGGMYIYFCGRKQGVNNRFYMGRAARDGLLDHLSYTYYAGTDDSGNAIWNSDVEQALPFFEDLNVNPDAWAPPPVVIYNPNIGPYGRYILSTTRNEADQIAIYDGPNPWGPWTTVAYETDWLNARGPYPLRYGFVNKWSTGLDTWMIFSAHRHNTNSYHDVFNLVRATFTLY